ncbi:MAG: hypothetical protein EOP20_00930 [Hyphomicrobiales bacterium]|nr:MAG: hypothetical protein EOP20_00930 [Hyphomicrobiales bacterium]
MTDYLIEQGAGCDPRLRATIYTQIYNGALSTFITVHPELPSGANARDIHRYANSKAREISVLESPRAKAELRKAVLGRDPDLSFLDTLTVNVPAAAVEVAPVESEVPDEASSLVNRKSKNDKRAEVILEVIEQLGIDRFALKGPTKIGRSDGDRFRIIQNVHAADMHLKDVQDASALLKAFDNAWSKMLKVGVVRVQKSTP